MKHSRFAKFAWFTLAYNVVVIVWGVFLRASKSGDGCGQHWLTCHGELIPTAPQLKTIIEFTHRIMSGIDFFVVLFLMIFALLIFPKRAWIRYFAILSFVFIITEALVGAGLVLTGNTADTISNARPFWAIGHLLNTFILLACLTMTAFLASYQREFDRTISKATTFGFLFCGFGLLLIGVSGVLAALASMLFPPDSLIDGLRDDFAPSSNILVRLRILHPIVSLLFAIIVFYFVGRVRKSQKQNFLFWRFARNIRMTILLQIAFGATTLLMLAPILMQMGHLLLADIIWIYFVLSFAASHSVKSDQFNTRPVLSDIEY